jgi:transposase
LVQLLLDVKSAGYALHRQLTALNIECVVVAPSLIPVRPGDKIKTAPQS